LDDGLLTASEIAQLKLDADWAVLSACNTMSKRGSEEGISSPRTPRLPATGSCGWFALADHLPLVIEFGSPPTDESYPSVHAAALCAMLATAPGGRWHQYVSRSVVGDLDQVVLGQAGLGYHLPSGVRRSGSSLQTRHLALEPGFEI
jgi:hypothetical protein